MGYSPSFDMAEPFGFLNIDKPAGMTSHDVVAKIRRGLGIKKVGHAGTLDPMATGVLVICVGGATRLSEYVMQSTKKYRAHIRLGITTETYDAEGEVQQIRDASQITQADVESILPRFLGDIQQVPPMYSAIKQGGRKLYEAARAGETIERQPRPVHIDKLDVVAWNLPDFTLDVVCSAGTYIRSLAYDMGEALGVGAHLSGLVRLASGVFQQSNAVSLDVLLSTPEWGEKYLIPPQLALADWPNIYPSVADIDNLRHGRAIASSQSVNGEIAFAYDADNQLVAIVQAQDGFWRPHKVFF